MNNEPIRYDIQLVELHEKKFAEKMKNEKGWYQHCSGGAMSDDIKKINIGFQLPQKGTIEQARKLIVETTRQFLEEINSDEKLRPYLHEVPFKPRNLDISLVFQFDLQDEKNIRSAWLMFDKIIYYKESKFFEETFEEAQQKLKGE